MFPPRLLDRLLAAILLVTACLSAAEASAGGTRGRFEHVAGGRLVPVWYFKPDGNAADLPVVFVMHGVQRNAEQYRDEWVEAAARRRFLLVVPEFSRGAFPGEEGYILGNLHDEAGRLRPESEWAFSQIEAIFDAVRQRFGTQARDYQIYGHSAGAQFVHRFILFGRSERCRRAIAANAGWYSWPDPTRDYPFGVRAAGIDRPVLPAALARDLVIMLGDADTDPQHSSLRKSEDVAFQGAHRYARGQNFFAAARDFAARSSLPFHWTLVTVPGVAHSNTGMTPEASRLLFPESSPTPTPP